MFGFVNAATTLLSEADKARYRGWYCGLCKALGRQCGQSCRLLLNYDMTFLAMLLSSVYDLPEQCDENTCLMHPFKPHTEITTRALDYAADMNVILSYYKLLDDWHDDKNPAALAAASLYSSQCAALTDVYPRQTQAIADCLDHLSELEADGECNPDLPANCFGRLMGELFVMNEGDKYGQELRAFGRTLGRFIYIIDAATDFRADLRRGRYNALVGMTSDEVLDMLHIMGGDFMRTYQRLPIGADRSIMDNILCVGIWKKYEAQRQRRSKKERKHGKEPL